ncbi:MAG: DUF3617 domain-containing protein [Caulobacteraceae bacterium]
MRTIIALAAGALTLTACEKARRPAGEHAGRAAVKSVAAPTRKAGLWEQSMTRDGRPLALVGRMRACVDAASEARLSLFGGKMSRTLCRRRSVSRSVDGVYAFASTCDMGEAGVIASEGVLTGDLSSRYRLHAQSNVTGSSLPSMNGRHTTDIEARYLGPCPPGMTAGDVIMANGMKINAGKLGAAAQALGGGG